LADTLSSISEQAQFSKLYHCAYALYYHLVICTKYRRKCIDAEMLNRFKEIAEARCRGWGGRLLELNGEADHVHLLIALPPNLNLSVFVNNLKTTSSRLLRKEFAGRLNRAYRMPVFWSRSYCIISCGAAPLSVLKQYVEQQKNPD
jgi:putative transposase